MEFRTELRSSLKFTFLRAMLQALKGFWFVSSAWEKAWNGYEQLCVVVLKIRNFEFMSKTQIRKIFIVEFLFCERGFWQWDLKSIFQLQMSWWWHSILSYEMKTYANKCYPFDVELLFYQLKKTHWLVPPWISFKQVLLIHLCVLSQETLGDIYIP